MRLLILTEVYNPEKFIINQIVDELFKTKFEKIIIITRVPSYPKGLIFKSYKNLFSVTENDNIKIIRYPIFSNYNRFKIFKLFNLIIQPIFTLLIFLTIKFDRLFVYQTGSIYTYSLLPKFYFKKKHSVIWSQDLWPEAGYEFGFPKIKLVDWILRNITRITLLKFNKVLVQSDGFKKFYYDKYRISSDVVYNFSSERTNLFFNGNKSKTLIYCGNIGSVQNLEELIIMYKKFYSYGFFNKFQIYGDGSYCNLLKKKYDKKMGIVFLGHIDRDILINKLKKCRFACLSLIDGPIRNTIPGRFQFLYNLGIPILYLGNGVVKTIIDREKCGVYFENNNFNKLKNDIEFFENNKIISKNIFSKKITYSLLTKFLKIN